MDCKKCRENISLFIDNQLDKKETAEFEQHLEECENCSEAYRIVIAMIQELNNLPLQELPEGYCKKLHEKLVGSSDVKMKKKWNWKTITTVAAAAIIVFSVPVLFGDSLFRGSYTEDIAESKQSEANYGMRAGAPDMMPAEAPMADYEEAAYDGRGSGPKMMYNGDIPPIPVTPQTSEDYRDRELKIVRNGNLSVETAEYDKTVQAITDKVRLLGGYIEQFETYTGNYSYYDESKQKSVDLKNGFMTIRVPDEMFQEVFAFISGSAEVKSERISETDMTKQYYDTESRVKNLELQEERLQEFLTKAENVGEIIQLEQELNRIRTEIELFRSNLADIDYRSSYATINLQIREIEDKKVIQKVDDKLWSRVGEAFTGSVNNMIDFIENFIVFTFAFIPVLVVIILPAAVVIWLVRKLYKKIVKR